MNTRLRNGGWLCTVQATVWMLIFCVWSIPLFGVIGNDWTNAHVVKNAAVRKEVAEEKIDVSIVNRGSDFDDDNLKWEGCGRRLPPYRKSILSSKS